MNDTTVAADLSTPEPRSKRRPQERSTETRARLVGCAIDCISEVGYSAATTPVIADRAGVSRGALQYHFASRADLDMAVVDHVANELNFRLDLEELGKKSLELRVNAVVDNYWHTFTSPAFRAVLNIWLGVASDPPVGRRLRDHLSEKQDRIEHTWQSLFQDTGRTPTELTTIRHVVMGSARGFAVERLFHPEETGEREKRVLARLTLHALKDDALGDGRSIELAARPLAHAGPSAGEPAKRSVKRSAKSKPAPDRGTRT